MATTSDLIKQLAELLDISERKLRSELVELGLYAVLNNACRLQAQEAFREKRLVYNDESFTPEQLRQAYKITIEEG